jgi:hypothetical protein
LAKTIAIYFEPFKNRKNSTLIHWVFLLIPIFYGAMCLSSSFISIKSKQSAVKETPSKHDGKTSILEAGDMRIYFHLEHHAKKQQLLIDWNIFK